MNCCDVSDGNYFVSDAGARDGADGARDGAGSRVMSHRCYL